jgi:hypothetical protein
LFARPEGCPQFYYLKFSVGGVGVYSICVGVASGGRHTAVICAVLQQGERITERPNSDTAKLSKVKKPTVRAKIAVGMGGVKKVKKTWMIKLQHCFLLCI